MIRDRLIAGCPAIWDGNEYVLFIPATGEFVKLAEGQLEEDSVVKTLLSRASNGTPVIIGSDPDRSLSMSLVVTKRCNLYCTYCFARSTPQAEGHMEPRVASWLVRKLSSTHALADIHFIGGEPTLNLAAVREAVEAAQSLPRRPRFFITTNGAFAAPVTEWLVEQGFVLSVSWDGLASHDRARPFANGRGSSRQVAMTIRSLVQREAHFRLRVTLTKSALPHVRDILMWCALEGVKFVHIEPLSPDGRGQDCLGEVPAPEEFTEAFLEAVEIAETHGLGLMNSALTNLFSPKDYFCPSVRGRMYHFNPDGTVSLCYKVESRQDEGADRFTVGRFDPDSDELVLESDRLQTLAGIHADSFRSCRSCHLKSVCCGGCPFRNFRAGPDGDVDPWTCGTRMGLLRAAILHLYRRAEAGLPSCLMAARRFYGHSPITEEVVNG